MNGGSTSKDPVALERRCLTLSEMTLVEEMVATHKACGRAWDEFLDILEQDDVREPLPQCSSIML
jgi:hypothetical protein